MNGLRTSRVRRSGQMSSRKRIQSLLEMSAIARSSEALLPNVQQLDVLTHQHQTLNQRPDDALSVKSSPNCCKVIV